MRAEKSTNVRKRAEEPSAPAWLRAALGGLAKVAPPLAARIGEQLFLTPPRHPAPQRERAALASAAPFEVPFRGGRLQAWRWGGDGTPVLLVHGWGGRGGQMAAFAPALVESGVPVVTFDGPAHGRSSGRLSSAPDFGEAIRAVGAHLGGARAVIAHSMGVPATVLALRDGLATEAAVFVGGSVGPSGFIRLFARAMGFSDTTRAALVRRLEARFGPGFESYDVRRDATTMSVPLLVIHDREDAEVAWAQGEAIARAWPGAELLTTEGLGHRRILRDAEVVARAAGFVARQLGARARVVPIASGANRGCATPGCTSAVCLSWDDGGRLCASCAVTIDLFDRSARQQLLASAG